MNISIYGGHNASVSFYDGKEYRIIELERLMRERYYMLFDKSESEFISVIKLVLEIAKNRWNINNDFETYMWERNERAVNWLKKSGMTEIESNIDKVIKLKYICQ